jgi:hypothetical protein
MRAHHETRYQYSDVNVVAIHHALMQSGIEPQPVDIVVTLPLGEYLDENDQPEIWPTSSGKSEREARGSRSGA